LERLHQRLVLADKALSTLEELAVLKNPTDVQRDAAIQRFEYSFEAVWRAAQRYLLVNEGLQVGSPKAVIRTSHQVGLLVDEQAERGLEMVDDRNLTVHTYNEALAEAIFSRLSGHLAILRQWIVAMQKRIKQA
jgi:nucleotidyltransferase substrate binding protein (TIGR01987 family)